MSDTNADQMKTQSAEDQEPPVTQQKAPITQDEQAAGADDEETNEMIGTNTPAENGPKTLGVGLSEE